jgi:Protein of unknown function (DUF2911)
MLEKERSMTRRTLAAVALLAIGGTMVVTESPVFAEQKTTTVHAGRGGSPHVRSEWTIDGANISIEYGRPALKGREIGKDVAPFGQVWRTGADEATTLKTDKMLMLGSVHLAPGTYTLYTLPTANGWQLIVNKQTGQWGTEYDAKQDAGRVPLTIGKAPAPVEQLTFSIDDTAAGATLRIEWGTIRLTTAMNTM